MRQSKKLPESLGSIRVVARFLLRMATLLLFAAFSGAGLARSMVALLWMAATLCTATAVLRSEPLLDADLNNWDEAVAYLALCCPRQQPCAAGARVKRGRGAAGGFVW